MPQLPEEMPVAFGCYTVHSCLGADEVGAFWACCPKTFLSEHGIIGVLSGKDAKSNAKDSAYDGPCETAGIEAFLHVIFSR